MGKSFHLLSVIFVSYLFLSCNKEENPTNEGDPVEMTSESMLNANNQQNNSNLRAVFSSTNQEIYVLFTSVPTTLDSTAIMFASFDMNGEILQSPVFVESVKSLSSFPNITASNGRIFGSWHGNDGYDVQGGLTLAELSSDGKVLNKYFIETAPPGISSNFLLFNQLSLTYFYSAEVVEDEYSIAYVQASAENELINASISFIDNTQIHDVYYKNSSMQLAFTQNGELSTAGFDPQSATISNIVNLASINHFDPVVSFAQLVNGECVAAYSSLNNNLSLHFYSSDGNNLNTADISSEAYDFSNITANDSVLSIAWVTGENNVNFTLHNYLNHTRYEIRQLNDSEAGMAIDPYSLITPNGIFTFWRDTRNHNGGDLYYRKTKH